MLDPELLGRTRERAFKLALKIVRNKERAQDIAQNVMLHYASGSGGHQKVEHAVIDALRKEYGRSDAKISKQKWAINGACELLEDITPGVEAHPLPNHDFLKTMGRLPDRLDRIAMILVFHWGFSYQEVAECMGVTESRIAQRVANARTLLIQRLKADC